MKSNIDIDTLARKIADNIANAPEVIGRPQLCQLLGLKADSGSLPKILAQPGFPPSFTLHESGREKWRRSDVLRWIAKKSALTSKMAMATMKH